MHVYKSIEELSPAQFQSPCGLTIGMFDGVHAGHQALLKELCEWSRPGDAIVVTFDTHPRKVLSANPPKLLTSLRHRLYLLERFGVSATIVLPFNDRWANVKAFDFLSLLNQHISPKRLLLGANHHFGKGREGNAEFAQKHAAEFGFMARKFELKREGVAISSTRIREHIANGELAEAEQLLGRNVSLFGEVVKGFQRGRQIGFPTANIALGTDTLTLPFGVYVAFAHCRGDFQSQLCVVNIGRRPTFNDSDAISVEAHLIDFDGDLYGREIELEFVEKLRGEKRFNGVDELVAQIGKDRDLAIQKYGQKKF